MTSLSNPNPPLFVFNFQQRLILNIWSYQKKKNPKHIVLNISFVAIHVYNRKSYEDKLHQIITAFKFSVYRAYK